MHYKTENNKSPGNDGLRKEYFETFRLGIKTPLFFYLSKKVFFLKK